MKNFMKSLMAVVLTVVVGVASVGAMSESDLEAKLTKAYTINGVTYQATAAEKNQIARYLANNEISATDADYIATKFDEAIAAIDASDTTAASFAKMPESVKTKLKAVAADITANTAVKVTVEKGTISLYNTDGTKASEFSTLVKQTDSKIAIIAGIALVVTVAGAFMVVRQVKSKTVTYA